MEYPFAFEQSRLVGEINARIDAYYNWVLMTGRLARWRTAFNTYYGQRGSHNSSSVSAAGEKGELSFLMSNEYRNLVRHTLVMATQSRTALEMVAINTDASSKSQAYTAKGLVEYYRRDGKIDESAHSAAEISLINDTAWVFNEWDTTLGMDAAIDPDSNLPVRQGDIKTRARTPLDVVIDFSKIDPGAQGWRIVRDPVNKFDLAAQYPDLAEQITKITRDLTKDAIFRFGDSATFLSSDSTSSDVDMWTLYHRRSPALPQGRMVQMVGELILFDGPIPYRKLPGNRICPAEMILSPLGYSDMNDLLGLQDVMDALISAGVTNMTTCGVNTIWTKSATNFDFEQLAKGMNLIETEEKPEILMMNRLPPEWFSLANFVIQRMEAISGMNSVARGNTQGKDFSGAAMALLQSMAIQFNSGFTRAVNKLAEDNGNDIIMLTQDFVSEPRIGLIIGENNRYMQKTYSGKDLSQIQRVYCRQSNPMKDTTAGRIAIIQEAAKTEGGLTKAQFAEILDTGNTDCLLEQDRNSKLAIDQENEAIIAGEIPSVLFLENHPNHIAGHAKAIWSPDDKKDLGLIDRMRTHIQEHLRVWRTTNPNILMGLKIPPLVAPFGLVETGQTPMPGQAAGPSGPPAQGDPTGRPMPNEAPPSALDQTKASPASPPGMPTNPLTGEKWNPETGGLPQGAS